MPRIVATGLVGATLAVGLGSGLGPGGGVAAAAGTPPTTTARPGAAQCARIQDRIAEVPGIQERIRARVDALEQRLASVADPRRRARLAAALQPRIDKLEQLGRRLDAQVALAERICTRRT